MVSVLVSDIVCTVVLWLVVSVLVCDVVSLWVAAASLPDIALLLPLPEMVAGFDPLAPEAAASLPDIALLLPLPEMVAGFDPLAPETVVVPVEVEVEVDVVEVVEQSIFPTKVAFNPCSLKSFPYVNAVSLLLGPHDIPEQQFLLKNVVSQVPRCALARSSQCSFDNVLYSDSGNRSRHTDVWRKY